MQVEKVALARLQSSLVKLPLRSLKQHQAAVFYRKL